MILEVLDYSKRGISPHNSKRSTSPNTSENPGKSWRKVDINVLLPINGFIINASTIPVNQTIRPANNPYIICEDRDL